MMKFRAVIARGTEPPYPIEIEASTAQDARTMLAGRGYAILSCHAVARRLNLSLFARTGRTSFDSTVFAEQLRDLLVAGLSVIEALDALRRGSPAASRGIFEILENDLKSGQLLSQALSKQTVFSELLVALVRASEMTSDLPQSLSRYIEHRRRVAELKNRLISVSIYPILLIIVGALVVAFLLFYVMPKFSRIFEGMSGTLPWSAKAMVAWSSLLNHHAGTVTALGATALFAVAAVVGVPRIRAQILGALLQSQPVSARLRIYFLTRWYGATGLLLEGGIPLPEALHLSNSVLPLAMQDNGAAVELHIRNGLSPSEAHSRSGMATPVAEQLLLVGERTGDLGSVMLRIAQFHDAEVGRAIERGMRALEPIVMAVLGLGIGIIVILMYLPIFELASSIQ